jgi:LuxR family maltose regulon positive regulatory protein
MSGESARDTRPRAPNGDPIMAAKLHPPARQPWVVARQRLFDRLSHAVDGPLTLVCAPAGTGKTVLAGSWVAAGRAPGPVVWLALDEDDDRPGVFWSYVLAGLGGSGVSVSEVFRPTDTDTVDHSLLIRLAAGLSERPEPVVLVLDNAQVLTAPAVLAGVDFLIQHAAPQLRVVLLTRTEPALPLHRYRVAGSITELGFGDLAFTPDEARALLSAHDAGLPPDTTRVLVEKSHGWAASLRLAAVADEGDLAAYFRSEVLGSQPPEVREFLLRTSIVDRLWPALAGELTGRQDAPRTLAQLAHTNAFLVPVPESSGSYAYHPLVRELLRAELRHRSPDKVGKLHRRAAHWYAEAGWSAEATEHAVASGDWGYAARLLVAGLAIGRLLAGPDGARFGALFAAMPADVAGPEGAVIQAAVASARLDNDLCAKHLLRARELVAVGPTEQGWALQLAIAVTEAACAAARGDVDGALAAIETAEAMLRDEDAPHVPVPASLHALILVSKGATLLRAGELDAATGALTAGLATADAPDSGYLRVVCLGQLALAESVRGRLRKAAQYARRAGAVADRAELPAEYRPPAADVALAWVHTEEYNLATARTHVTRAGSAPGLKTDPVSAGMLAVVRARLLRARGDLAGALTALDREPPVTPAGPVPGWLREVQTATGALVRTASGATVPPPPSTGGLPPSPQHAIVTAAAQLARGQTGAAGATVADLLRRTGLALDVRVEAGLLAATCELTEGRTELARGTLDRALGLAAGERLRRPVIEAPPRLRRFLRQERDLVERHDWLGAAVIGTPPTRVPPPGLSGPVVEPLTDKETEVLRCMAALLSTEEIARTMFVSVNTVKTHIRGVLRKLAATRRNEAVRRARELGLV